MGRKSELGGCGDDEIAADSTRQQGTTGSTMLFGPESIMTGLSAVLDLSLLHMISLVLERHPAVINSRAPEGSEGGSLLQAAHAQKRLIVGHATKISKRLALKKDAPLSVGLKGPYSIMNVQRPSSMPDELDCGFQGEVSQFLSYESAAATTGS